jgi:hypothetical protein
MLHFSAHPLNRLIARTPMPISPQLHKKSAAAARLGVLLLSFAAIALTHAKAERSPAYLSYRDYLNYHGARIDGELHPDLETRTAAAAQAAKLQPAADNQDIDAIRNALKTNSVERRIAIDGLKARSVDLAAGVLESEAKLLALAKRRDDAKVAAENKPSDAEITAIESRIAWLRARADFFAKETVAFVGEPTEAERAGKLYAAFISMEEARQLGEFTPDPERKRLAEAAFEIQSQRLRGRSIDAARAGLPARGIATAARELDSKLKSIPARLTALAKRHPDESNRLLALQKFYAAELKQLRALRTPKKAR